ncbi:cobalamin-binding protein [Marinobacteraceae bacterium S3BR75-40.1]
MIHRLSRLCLLLALLALGWPLAAGATIRITDASGYRVTLAGPAQRIVSLAPHLTENLFAIGEGGRIVGTSSYSDHPPAARRIPRVGTHDRIDLEQLLALKPDLVLLWLSGNGRAEAERLRKLGLTVVATEAGNVEAIAATLRLLGRLTGTARGEREAEAFLRGMTQLASRYSDRRPVRVFYQIWQDPLMTIGGAQIISDVLDRCGARNIFAAQNGKAFAVGREAVLARQPQALVAPADDGSGDSPLAHWQSADSLPAVQQHHMIVLQDNALARPTPGILPAARELCQAIDGVRQSLPPRKQTQE